MKSLALIGSTGSIGVNTLAVVESDPDRWKVTALACGRNAELVAAQARKHRPDIIAVADEETVKKLEGLLDSSERPGGGILAGEKGLQAAARHDNADVVLVGVSGARGLKPAWEAAKTGKRLALANKEALVLAGDALFDLAGRSGSEILPVDSEHSALFQLLQGVDVAEVKMLWLGASGGPFRNTSKPDMEKITPQQALAHPVWKMGPRITIDSATMMNKGLEIIEACRLFSVAEDKVGVFVHPQGLVHAMVEMNDGVMLAHVSRPDMKGPIAYAMYYPERPAGVLESPDLFAQKWAFEPADAERFSCLELARRAVRTGGTMPAALNAADEIAVQAFLDHKLAFNGIPKLVEAVMDAHETKPVNGPDDALQADEWARGEAERVLDRMKS